MLKLPFSVRSIGLLWLAWLVSLLAFQSIVMMRFRITRPDRVLEWTPADTGRHNPREEPTLTEPFLNTQVAFDSEYYLSIATVGYDDPLPGRMRPPSGGPLIPLNYAFFPLYPYAIRLVSIPLQPLGLTPIATATLAGVLVSALGALAAMIALYDLSRDELGEEGALRTAFYLLIFPTGFFLAQVYTEGLFIGLAFVSLALVRRRRLAWASLLAVLAVYTRAIGVALVLPLAWAWVKELRQASSAPGWRTLTRGLWVVLPWITYALWRSSAWGEAFTVLEEHYFGRQLFALEISLESWKSAWAALSGSNEQTAVYYALEFGAIAIGSAAGLMTLRRYPDLALFSLLALVVPLTSGYLQSMQRYVLALPSLYLALSHFGKNPVFDRVWTLVSILLMGFLAMLYSFNFWTA